jgi:uncharacterized protein YceH (UPF0502 family)
MQPIDAVEARVLGVLIEKEATTPEYYPLSVNAMVTACNQKTNRYPVVEYDERTVLEAIERLKIQRFAASIVGSGRVVKYAQRMSETLNLGRRELAALGVLLLRGPQTLGEVKDRTERIYAFTDLEEVERVLEKLAQFPAGAMARRLPRMPGQKEARYAHLLAGEPDLTEPEVGAPQSGGRVTQLEQEVAAVRADLADLKRRFDELEAQLR